MKVVILGGYGVFGTLLAELLIRDGHSVWIAGRDLNKAQVCAGRLGAQAIQVDLHGNLQALFDHKPDVVIDAAGPYQLYGTEPYRIARACVGAGVNYLDLSDDADFTAGIAALNSDARRAGCWVLSGASSVPGLSSAVVTALSPGLDDILLIDTAILPGNRAPRGVSVITSIVGQVGQASQVWRGGMWRDTVCWSDKRVFELAPGLKRTGYFISVPDIKLFPDAFRARSVMFRAGMELGVLNAGLSTLRRLRQLVPIKITPARARFMKWLSDLLLPFGSDRGAMQVAVTSRVNGSALERTWRLIAEAGDGPYVPCIVARALLRAPEQIASGARPCLSEIPLADIEAALSDLAVSTTTSERDRPSLFQSALQERWTALAPEAQALHDVHDVESFSGTADVTRGMSLLARFTAWFVGFPAAGEDVPLTVTKTRTEDGEIWERNFGGQTFRSYLSPSATAHCYRERFWLFTFEVALPVEHGVMQLPVRRGWFAGIPIPRFLLPASDAREYVKDGIFHFDVALSAPLGQGLIVRYRGSLKPLLKSVSNETYMSHGHDQAHIATGDH